MSPSQQPSIFAGDLGKDPAVESWSQVIARRMQSMVMGFPIHQMVAKGESGHHPHWTQQNFTFLALQVFDSVFARMSPGLGRGATREQINQDLKPFILAVQSELSDKGVEEIVDFVLNHLMNDGKGTFQHECIWLDEEQMPKPYPFRFGLLRAYHDPGSDQFIIRATTEAIHLYLRVFDQPIEDDQIANLIILREQVARGRIGRARREAERTMLLSLEYERYIEDMLRAVRRDVRSVNWIKEVTPRLEEAHQHVRRLIKEQGAVLASLKNELQNAAVGERFTAIFELIELLETCQKRHMALERQLLSAGPTFLEEQAYQRFRSMARSPMPDLNEQIFMPALTLDAVCFRPVLPEIFRTALGPELHRLFDLEVFVEKLFREETPSEPQVDEEDLEERTPVGPLFDPVRNEIEQTIAEILIKIGEIPVRLSQILEMGRAQGMDLQGLSLIGVTLLHSYHAKSDLLGLRVVKDGATLDDPDFMGDDLLVARQQPAETKSKEIAHVG